MVTIESLQIELNNLKKEFEELKRNEDSISRFVQKLKNNDFLISEEEFLECLN